MSELMDRARHRISVGDYHKMADAGVLSHQDRVELIEGEIVDMAPIGSQHAYVVNQLARLFTLAAGEDCLVSTQNPIRLDDRSEPQPDLALLKPGDYMAHLPGLADILLVVEVASSSIDYDRGVKLDLYARHGIPEVWLLDLTGNELLVCRDPVGGRYLSITRPRAGECIRPLLLPGIAWRLAEGKTWSVPF
ncbi:Uma2 family endonuclease [Candidatus Accumulibacter aalborgensis]|nr:Uma2 family endonuclease [Candidatus Accumulibacter aalborgensis]